jgi:hypothetical protein
MIATWKEEWNVTFFPLASHWALEQNPFAGIRGCADSRVGPRHRSPEPFVCRVAGNFADVNSIAGFEYAVAVLGTPFTTSCDLPLKSRRCASQSLEGYAEIRPKHGGILDETGAARLDDILNKGLDENKFVELDSVEAF